MTNRRKILLNTISVILCFVLAAGSFALDAAKVPFALKAEAAKQQEALNVKEETISTLTEKTEAGHTEIETLKAEAEARKTEKETLEAETAKQQEALAAKEETIKTLTAELETRRAEIESLKAVLPEEEILEGTPDYIHKAEVENEVEDNAPVAAAVTE